jgi:hypothetical protein
MSCRIRYIRGGLHMVNVLESKISQRKLKKLEQVFEQLECKKVMVEYINNEFPPSYPEEYFNGWFDDEGVYIGNIEYAPLIKWESIDDIQIRQIDFSIEIVIGLLSGNNITIYN